MTYASSSSSAIRHTPPPPPPEQDEIPIAESDERSAPSLSPRSDDDASDNSTGNDDDTDASTRHDTQREWKRTASDAQGQAPLPSGTPALKRQRTATADPICETFSRHHDGEIIALIRKHGGEVMDRQGDAIRLSLPPATNLAYRVAVTCLKLEYLRGGKPFTGRDPFAAAANDEFAGSLEAAAMANQPTWVEQLLATGWGNRAGELLRRIARRCELTGAHEAMDVITDQCAYWAQGPGADNIGWPTESRVETNGAAPPASDWQSATRAELSDDELQDLIASFRAGNAPAVCQLLFHGDPIPATGTLSMRTFTRLPSTLADLLRQCGVLVLFDQRRHGAVAVYSTDIDRAALKEQLLELQAEQSRPTLIPHADTGAALLLAAQWGDLDIFVALAERETRLAGSTNANWALKGAADAGATEILRYLLRRGVGANRDQATGNEALRIAAGAGRTEACALLLNHGIPLDMGAPVKPALTVAASNGHVATCAFLIQQGADINAAPLQPSALQTAAEYNWTKTCRLLVTAGAAINPPIHTHFSALAHAARNGNIALYDDLLSRGADPVGPDHQITPLSAAAGANEVAMLNHLLAQGTQIDYRAPTEVTALMHACRAGALEAAQLLYAHGASLDPLMSVEENALVNAVFSGQLPLLRFVIRLFDRNAPDYWVHALNWAIKSNKVDMVQALIACTSTNPLQAGLPASQNPLLAIGYQPSRISAPQQARHEILDMLLRNGVPLHHVDTDGNDALILAVKGVDVIATSKLLDAGMRIGQANQKGKNALHYAFTQLDYADIDDSSDLVRRVGIALARQDNRSALIDDQMLKLNHPVQRDICMQLSHVQVSGSISAERLNELEQAAIEQCRRLLLAPATDGPNMPAASRLNMALVAAGMTSALIPLLMPSLQILKTLSADLFGPEMTGTERVFRAAVDGIYLSHEQAQDPLAEKFAMHYADEPIDDLWKESLTAHSSRWLADRVMVASAREHRYTAPTFEKLFSLCADKALAGNNYGTALALPAIQNGEITHTLVAEGIYIRLAAAIETAWHRAWQRVASQQPSASDANSADSDASPVAATLLSEFRAVLKTLVDTPSTTGTLLTPTNAASPDAAQLYGDLMFRQLHMLAQFINPERTMT